MIEGKWAVEGAFLLSQILVCKAIGVFLELVREEMRETQKNLLKMRRKKMQALCFEPGCLESKAKGQELLSAVALFKAY